MTYQNTRYPPAVVARSHDYAALLHVILEQEANTERLHERMEALSAEVAQAGETIAKRRHECERAQYYSEVTSQNLGDASSHLTHTARTLGEVSTEYHTELQDLLDKRKAREGVHLAFEKLLGQEGLHEPSPQDLLAQRLNKATRQKRTQQKQDSTASKKDPINLL